ncbi:hypothetical protein PABG_07357 [Paracoccidioides brasiliensis Pb03]|nr:hypothetical protein PABG_07357 [Paracoccidioides brasiliensis Pb03]
MPVKWNAEMDQQLLLKIIETHDLRVDTERVSDAWPGDEPKAKPTPRAITERLVKIKSIIKNNNGATPTSTPRKKLATTTFHNRTPAKRKRGDAASDNKENIKIEGFVSPTSNTIKIKNGMIDCSDSSMDEMRVPHTMRTTSKSARVVPPLPAGIVTYIEGTDDDSQYESGNSEFIHPAKVEVDNGYNGVQVRDDAIDLPEYA